MKRRTCLQAFGVACAGRYAGSPHAQQLARVQVPEVGLVDQDGAPHRLRALCDTPVVISFFYTGCSTVCPPQTAALRALRERLDTRPALAPRVRLLSISVDPLGDSPAALRDYARRFDLRLGLAAGWQMLTGAPNQLGRTWQAFEVPVGDPAAHSSLLWLGDLRQGRWTRASPQAPTERLLDLIRQVST